jgi:ribonucleoside-diphosphate reductase alpha chain
MYVTKRSGEREKVSFDKVLARIEKLAEGLEHVNPTLVTQKVCSQIQDGIHTSELDSFAAETCAMMVGRGHPNYGLLAARIAVDNHQKNTPSTFSECVFRLGLSEKLMIVATVSYANEIEQMIDYSRDFRFDYFGFKTLEKGYLLRDETGAVLERPQHMWMRTAVEIHTDNDQIEHYGIIEWRPDLKKIRETYDALSLGYFIHATPTLFNAGTDHAQLSSCFLQNMKEDSIKGIYDTLGDCAQISKWAGGVGLSIHNIRARNSDIRGTRGKSTGIVPMLKVFNDTARYVNQGGKRNGSFAVYLEPWHADIEDFLKMKLNTGAEEDRARDLFYALWIPDLFMKRLEANESWTLMCPNECPGLADCHGPAFESLYESYERAGKGRKTLPAQKIWQLILDAQIQTGTPYLCYKDAANAKSNQQNLGTIKSSNLCVAPETLVLTDKGQFPIRDLAGTKARVWNGEVFSEVDVIQTGADKELIDVVLSNGVVLTCTPYHKFLVKQSYHAKAVRIDAQDLKTDMKLDKYELPTIAGNAADDIAHPYTHGFYCGDGTYANGTPRITLYGEKKELVKYLNVKSISGVETANQTLNVHLHKDIDPKFKVPINSSLSCRLEWLAGLVDADGGIARNGTNESIQICSIEYQFLTDIQRMLTNTGVSAKVVKAFNERQAMLPDGRGGHKLYDCKKSWRLLISSTGLYHLATLGFVTHRIKWTVRKPQRNAEQFVKVVEVINTGRFDDTYCFNEPLNHAGMFNGILTGNCSEIIEYSSPTETAVCNLGSLSLPRFVRHAGTAECCYDFEALRKYTRILARNLDNVIDRNYYPTPECRNSNMRHRPIGIGVQGLADVFAMMKLPWQSKDAEQLNIRIFANIYYAAIQESHTLALERGPYLSFTGSPADYGRLQPQLWRVNPDEELDWTTLRSLVSKDGLRNSLSIALMPTASTSQILGNNECFEPFTSNLYVRHVLAGDFIIINKYLVEDLVKLGLWNADIRNRIIADNGSVQGIPGLPSQVRELYRTAWEIPMKTIINMSADRGPYVCQSQSLNLFVADPTYARISSMHVYAWKKGLKTGCYYLRTKAVASAQKFTVEPSAVPTAAEPECLMCSA